MPDEDPPDEPDEPLDPDEPLPDEVPPVEPDDAGPDEEADPEDEEEPELGEEPELDEEPEPDDAAPPEGPAELPLEAPPPPGTGCAGCGATVADGAGAVPATSFVEHCVVLAVSSAVGDRLPAVSA